MKIEQWIKKNETSLKVIAIALIVFVFWLAFSPPTTAREGIANWFGGINSIFLVLLILGIAFIIIGSVSGAGFLIIPGIVITALGALLFYGVGLIQNIFATTNPIVLIVVGLIIVWFIMRPKQPPKTLF